MRQTFAFSFLWLATTLAVVPHAVSAAEPVRDDTPTAEQLGFFEKSIRPLLIERCYECHSERSKTIEGGLRLDSLDSLARGGDSGAAIVPGAPDKSLLVTAIGYNDPLLQMPPDGKLSDREINGLIEWVRMGAPEPRTEDQGNPLGGLADMTETTDSRQWWSFQPVKDPPIPAVRNSSWPANPIDHFVLAKLEEAGMQPAPQASARTLVRRAYFDLIGLPPPPKAFDSFIDAATAASATQATGDVAPHDPAHGGKEPGNPIRRDVQLTANAWAILIDELLDSDHYGERWGRHWLDVVRYADTSGCNGDFPMPDAYRYRNYVIDSFNKDKPYDQFVREQIAGDILGADSDEQRFEQTIATGYLAISRRFSSLGEEFHLTLDDTIDNLGKAVLGLSISCARCHEHKFDPIPQEDYYALYGIFQSTRYAFPGTEIYRHTQDLVPLVSSERLEQELRPYLDRMAELDGKIFGTYSTMAEQDTGKKKDELRAEWQKMQKQRDELVKKLPGFDKAYAATEGEAVNVRLHVKGDPQNLGDEVPRRFLEILGGQPVPPHERGSGRLQLAQWLTDPDNPLTARVIVNRVWQHHFGRGIVRTSDDFGTRGTPPTHPRLLDYLTRRFIESGWSIKSLHRLIMRSRTYQTAAVERQEYARHDPDNQLLWTFNRRRLSAEEIRDAMLAVSGALDQTRGGDHPFPPEWEWRYTQHKPFVDDFPTNRRSVYLMQQRIRQQPYLAVFDGADTNAVTGFRKTSTTPPQALFMMNSEFVHEQAGLLAGRLAAETTDPMDRIQRAYQLTLGRRAGDEEIDEAGQYLAEITGALKKTDIGPDDLEHAAWSSYCRVLFGSNEFLFVE